MNELPKNAFQRRPDLHVETEGEFKGWQTWTRDNFVQTTTVRFGTGWTKTAACNARSGSRRSISTGKRNVHGGCFMSFADYCLFAIASSRGRGLGVTVSFLCEFLDAAHEGELVECEGEITRAGGSLIFLAAC